MEASIAEILKYTFYGCSGLNEITLPTSLTNIGTFAFYECDNLERVYYEGDEEAFLKITVASNNAPFLNATKYFNCNEAILLGATAIYEKGVVDISAETRNASSATLFAVGYNSNNTVVFSKRLIDGSGSASAKNVDFIKVFCWDGFSKMTPYCKAVWAEITEKIEIKSAKVSQPPESANKASNVIDGDLSTQWACNDEGNIVLDMGEIKNICRLNFYLKEYNDKRTLPVTVELSKDNTSWEMVFSGTVTVNDEYKKQIEVEEGEYRYARISVNGSSIGAWCSVTEVEIYGKKQLKILN